MTNNPNFDINIIFYIKILTDNRIIGRNFFLEKLFMVLENQLANSLEI